MSVFNKVIDLNNDGVNALLNSDQTTAIDHFERAIKLARTELSDNNEDMSTKELNECALGRIQNTNTVEIPSMESSDTIVFNQAVRLPAGLQLCASDKNVYTSAVIFNYALAHHFKASCGDVTCMAKAEKLYCLVLKLLNKKLMKVHTALVVKLACINNLSQIRYSQGDFANAREGVEQVKRFVRESSDDSMIKEPNVQGLLMNVLLLKAPVVAKAA